MLTVDQDVASFVCCADHPRADLACLPVVPAREAPYVDAVQREPIRQLELRPPRPSGPLVAHIEPYQKSAENRQRPVLGKGWQRHPASKRAVHPKEEYENQRDGLAGADGVAPQPRCYRTHCGPIIAAFSRMCLS